MTHRTDHAACCCQDTLTERTALLAAYGAATARADAMEARIKDTLGERDRARNLAARLEDQLAQVAIAVENLAALEGLLRGFEPGAAAVLDGATRGLREILDAENGAPETPDVAVPGPSGALGRPGSEIRYADAYPHESGPESPSA